MGNNIIDSFWILFFRKNYIFFVFYLYENICMPATHTHKPTCIRMCSYILFFWSSLDWKLFVKKEKKKTRNKNNQFSRILYIFISFPLVFPLTRSYFFPISGTEQFHPNIYFANNVKHTFFPFAAGMERCKGGSPHNWHFTQ